MIGAANYFASAMWAPRYWMKVGAAASVFNPAWATGSNAAVLGIGGPF